MIQVRKSEARGLADHGWLKSRHTFSFADYYDPKFNGFSVLRVINEDRIQGGTGFGTHGHRDMEIISYVVEGALEHKDSMGTETVIKPGEIQRMSAGTGVRHSEYNKLKDQTTHFLQIWIVPEAEGTMPSYDQKSFESSLVGSDLILVGSRQGRDGSIVIHQDVDLYVCKSTVEGEKRFKALKNRNVWIQMVRGSCKVENQSLASGDGAAISGVVEIRLQWQAGTEFILFDLP